MCIICACSVGLTMLSGADFCAVKISVKSPDNIPLTVPVQLLNAAGELVDTLVSEDGVAEICDLDFGDHTIVVGTDSCGQTTLRHIRLCYGKTQHIQVTMTSCPCSQETLLKCLLYFRVSTEGKQKLANVNVRSESANLGVTDEFGRAQIIADLGQSMVLIFSKTGFEPVPLSVKCSVPARIERSVVLAPIRR